MAYLFNGIKFWISNKELLELYKTNTSQKSERKIKQIL
jgi:hypothetical protein